MNSLALYTLPRGTPVSVLKALISFPHRTANSSLSIYLMSCTSSASIDFSKSLTCSERLTVLKALLISDRYFKVLCRDDFFTRDFGYEYMFSSTALAPIRCLSWRNFAFEAFDGTAFLTCKYLSQYEKKTDAGTRVMSILILRCRKLGRTLRNLQERRLCNCNT